MKEKNENQRVLLTKRLLREGLLRLLGQGPGQKPIDRISVSELCREAGINRATFYKHYAAPVDVLKDIEEELAKDMKKRAKKPESLEEAEVFLQEFCTHLYRNREIVKILIRSSIDDSLAMILEEFSRNLWEMRNRFHRLKNLDADSMRLVSAFLGSGSYYLIRQWLTEDIPKSPGEVAALSLNLLRGKNLT